MHQSFDGSAAQEQAPFIDCIPQYAEARETVARLSERLGYLQVKSDAEIRKDELVPLLNINRFYMSLAVGSLVNLINRTRGYAGYELQLVLGSETAKSWEVTDINSWNGNGSKPLKKKSTLSLTHSIERKVNGKGPAPETGDWSIEQPLDRIAEIYIGQIPGKVVKVCRVGQIVVAGGGLTVVKNFA